MTVLLAVVFAILVTLVMAVAMWFGNYLVVRQHENHWQKQLNVIGARASEDLTFRLPELNDRPFYLEMGADQTAALANGWSPQELLDLQARFDDPEKFQRLRQNEVVAVETATGTPVATLTFSSSPLDREKARSIGVQVHPKARGKGYGRQAMHAAILYLQLDPAPIHVGTRINNLGMQRIMEQLGYKPFDETTPYLAPDGVAYPARWYSCGADTHPPRLSASS